MKKKLLILLLLLIVVASIIYIYAYQDHRNIKSEVADYSVTIPTLQEEFSKNDSLANTKYADKTIQVSGKITSIDFSGRGIVIEDKLFGTFNAAIPKIVTDGKLVKIKGRFLGYDELLEEFKMDQISIVE